MRAKKPQKNSSLVRGIRALQGLSQTELAQRMRCSQARISRIEKHQVSLPKKDATQLAKALGVTPQTLFPTIEGSDD